MELKFEENWYRYEGPTRYDDSVGIITWCDEKFGIDNWEIDPMFWHFKKEEDLMLFILTWGE